MRLSHQSLAPALFLALASHRAVSQPRTPQLRAVADLRIDKAFPQANRFAVLTIGPLGEMIVAGAQLSGAIRGFDSTGRALSWSIPFGNGLDSDIRWVWRMGWTGTTLWVADPGFSQLALIDRRGKVTKSLEYPSWVRPAWADRRKFPVFGGVEPLALYADGSWLVRPSRERSVLSTPEYDKSFGYLMRINENGSVQRVVARVPRNDVRFDFRIRNSSQAVLPSYAPLTVWDASTDGSRVVVVTTALRGVDSASYRVTALGALGDTAYSRRIPFVPVAMSKQSIDSVRTRFSRSVGQRSAEEVGEARVKQLPWAYPPVESVLAGRDQTTWIELRSTTAERTWLVLDPTGAPIGALALPKEFVLRAAERERAWGFDRDGDQLTSLVRYKISSGAPITKR
jgi:hypothetical protein